MFQDSESEFENDLINIFKKNEYNYIHNKNLNRKKSDIILKDRLRSSLININKNATSKSIELAIDKIISNKSDNPKVENKNQYKHLSEGISVKLDTNEYETLYPIDFDNPSNNDFLVVNQLQVRFRDNPIQIPDVVVFVNGIPLAVFELKSDNESAETLKDAYNQITNKYLSKAPNLFFYNQFIAVENRHNAKVGSFTTPWDWMMPWRYINKEPKNIKSYEYEPAYISLVNGLFNKNRFLDIFKNYTLYNKGSSPSKIVPAYYQYYGVESAIDNSIDKLNISSLNSPKNRQIGICSHSQGSGKSISIAYYINKLKSIYPNTLFIVLTDTNDLDEQIHGETFKEYGINSKHVDSIDKLREELSLYKKGGGGVITTTIQKFQKKNSNKAKEKLNMAKSQFNKTEFTDLDELSIRKVIDSAEKFINKSEYANAINLLNEEIPIEIGNMKEINKDVNIYNVDEKYLNQINHPILNERDDIIVISDEAHRSQNETLGINVRTALPNASQIGFTATPKYNNGDNITSEWFGDVISEYQMDQAVEDGSIVDIDYQKRAPKIGVNIQKLKEVYEEESKNDESFNKVKMSYILKQSDRQKKIAKDVVEHFNQREINGAAMLVVYDRDSAMAYQNLIRELPNEFEDIDSVPDTHAIISNPSDYEDDEDENDNQDKDLKSKFKNVESSFDLAIVCNKWTTGFNIKHLHTIYLDKPLHGHNVVQTLGRVNRTYNDKEKGLVVDYIGMEDSIEEALSLYTTESNNTLNKTDDLEEELEDEIKAIQNIVNLDNISGLSSIDIDRKVEKEIRKIIKYEQESNVITYFKNIESKYKRLHPCETTKRYYKEIEYLARIVSQLKTIITNPPEPPEPPGNTKGINKIIEEAIESEEAVQIDMIEGGKIKENIINPEIDIPRAKKGIEKLLSERNKYSLKTYEEVKENIESAVKKYNSNIISSEEAKEELQNAYDRIKKEEQRSKDLDLNNRELTIFDILSQETKLIKENKLDISTDIDSLILDLPNGWHTRTDLVNDVELNIYSILNNYENINNSLELSEKIVHQSKKIY